MTTRIVQKLNTSINLTDWIVSTVAGLFIGWVMYYISVDIDSTVLAGLGMYLVIICAAYYRRNWLAYRAYFEDRIPTRVRDAERESAQLRRQLKTRPVDIAVINPRYPSGKNNVFQISAEIRKSFPEIAPILLSGSPLSRRSISGILTRSQIATLQTSLFDMDLLNKTGKSYYLNDSGISFFEKYAGHGHGLGGQSPEYSCEPAHAAHAGEGGV